MAINGSRNCSSSNGGHRRKIEGTLPATYLKRLYGSLPRNRKNLLTQLRTGHTQLVINLRLGISISRRRSLCVRRARKKSLTYWWTIRH
ncbi:hypothetical protein N7462_009706 [Penicillium macrosclerotiorum]|uniref:uncharacterized protein n=1 Tax=Penicillium macrosclerotiorum TaxID=303699 RepID=UPI002547857E|nr:uncharacterized protein N7462_009706 [Penicillium macrosclerotiorum]KAJ5674267.1 hypothetical protein N7462_009706 [Penicillium macrosclerotiorum]